MKILIWLTLVVELLVGLLLLFVPSLAPPLVGVEGMGLAMARLYGAAAVTIAVLCFWAIKFYDSSAAVSLFLHTMIAFQFLVIVSLVISYVKGDNLDLGALLLHSVFLIAYIYFYIKKR